ncbi:MAG: hypothetical protein U9R27_05600, partial [Campylobacterota bacterium]|nr:hypothetical protein [Campylobacterota bacterium]
INQSDLTLNEVFKRTRASVYLESDEKQMPWTSSSVIGDFYFQIGSTYSTPIPPPPSQPNEMRDEERAELILLREMKKQRIEAEQAELARLRRESLREKSATESNHMRQNSQNFSSSKQKNQPYVCYDRKYLNGTSKVVYSGCVRSRFSCKSIGKYHFGKYLNDKKAHSAYMRCSSGKPKFIDRQGVMR